MGKFIKQKQYVRATILSLLSFFLIITNQNCTPKDLGALTSKKGLSSLSGGEAYDGKLKPGTYVHEVIQMGCEGNSANERATIKVDENYNVELESKSPVDCGVSDKKLETSDLDHYADNANYIAHAGQIFKSVAELEKGWVTEIWCRAKDTEQSLNFYADYNPESKKSINRMSVGLTDEERLTAQRSLVGTQLSYATDKRQVSIDLSSEVFLGARKYNAIMTENDKVQNLFCYAGSGVLPSTTSKKIDSTIITGYYLSSFVTQGMSPDKHAYFHAVVDNDLSLVNIKVLDLLSGVESSLAVDLPYKSRIIQNIWVNGKHENLYLVIASEERGVIENPLIEGSLRDFTLLHVKLEVDGAKVSRVLESKYALNNVNQVYYGLLSANDKGLVWAQPGLDSHNLDFVTYDFNSHVKREQSFDLRPMIEEVSAASDHERKLFIHTASPKIPDNFNRVLFRIGSTSVTEGHTFNKYSRLSYIDLESGHSQKASLWHYWALGGAVKWLSNDEFWFGDFLSETFINSVTEHALIVKRVQVTSDSLQSTEILRSDKHELYGIKKVGLNSNEVLLSLVPRHWYKDFLPKKFIKVDMANSQITDTFVLTKGYTWYMRHLYIPFFNRVFMQYSDTSSRSTNLNFVALNPNTEVYSNDQMIKTNSFGTPMQYDFASKANKHLFAIKTQTFNSETLNDKYTIKEYSAAGTKHNFKPYLSDVVTYEYIAQSERIIYSKMVDSKLEFFLRDLASMQTINLTKRLDLPGGNILAGVEPVKNSSSLILKVSRESVSSGYSSEYDTYILTLDDM